MSASPWDPSGTSGGSDPFADALTGLVARARQFRALMEQLAPPTGTRPAKGEPSPMALAALGLLSLCARVEALFGDLPAVKNSNEEPPRGGGDAPRGALLR